MKQIGVIILLLSLLSSFTFAQTKLSAEILKRVEDATPKSLPQTPVAPKLKSDAEDENLKGKVKSIIEETERIDDIGRPYNRRFSIIYEFNEKGNDLKQIYFDSQGRPYSITVFGYIDGMRVSKSGDIIYEDDGPTIQIAKPKSKDAAKTEPDLRYRLRFEYKYVDGKLAEMQLYDNTGLKWLRHVYTYSENQMERLVYTENGELNQKYITLFDKKNNEIEWNVFDIRQPKIYGDNKYSIKYLSFDKKGNWTKRTYSELTTENGKQIYKPAWHRYRTITYY